MNAGAVRKDAAMQAGRQIETLEVIPDPVSLMESMRAVGYTVEAAVADIVDNSLSAGARSVRIRYDATGEPFVAVIDDGHGMLPDELTNAMRHGSRNPSEQRAPGDLGRFGLGLKTASLSQCRRLTVVSRKAGQTSARRWDLDVVQDSGQWLVVVPREDELARLPMHADLCRQECGTLVVWQELDRLVAGAQSASDEMTTRLAPLLEHLALVFHRFLQQESGIAPVGMSVNGLAVPLRDPFLRSSSFSQKLEGQMIRHERGDVGVQPHVLPPVGRLSAEEIELAGGRDGLRGTQGFYVYRNRRLVMWGTWFRIVPKEEFFKLTRVQVDIPNSFDDLWALDIKKSAAFPPEAIRNRLRELIPHFAGASRRTVTYPGRRTGHGMVPPLWERIEPVHGGFRYSINRDHTLLQQLVREAGAGFEALETLLRLLEGALPVQAIYADMCGDARGGLAEADAAELVELGARLVRLCGLTLEAAMEVDPLARHPELKDRIMRELDNGN